MARIGNFQEAYTTTVWWHNYEPYTPYGQSVASRMHPEDTYTEREIIMWNYAKRVEDLEELVRKLSSRIVDLESIVWWDHQNRLNDLEQSAWFSYVDLNKW